MLINSTKTSEIILATREAMWTWLHFIRQSEPIADDQWITFERLCASPFTCPWIINCEQQYCRFVQLENGALTIADLTVDGKVMQLKLQKAIETQDPEIFLEHFLTCIN